MAMGPSIMASLLPCICPSASFCSNQDKRLLRMIQFYLRKKGKNTGSLVSQFNLPLEIPETLLEFKL